MDLTTLLDYAQIDHPWLAGVSCYYTNRKRMVVVYRTSDLTHTFYLNTDSTWVPRQTGPAPDFLQEFEALKSLFNAPPPPPPSKP